MTDYGLDAVAASHLLGQVVRYDVGNVYDPAYLNYLARDFAPGQVFAGTDYPYDIMQRDPRGFVERLNFEEQALDSLFHRSAESFLGEEVVAKAGYRKKAREDQEMK